ncbi:MAG: hypothetical protein JW772_00020 [Candidatus Diapherotrites archaeon]|nr:hypothetical protein [Candidatus Diapherotrites archaeon]
MIKMFSRSQAGLEYLMTYGWALVLIVSVASVLFFVFAPPQQEFLCRSSDPTKIVLESYYLEYNPDYFSGSVSDVKFWGYYPTTPYKGEMTLVNATGGPIRITKAYADKMLSFTWTDSCKYSYMFSPGKINGTVYWHIPAWAEPVALPAGGKARITEAYLSLGASGSVSCPSPKVENYPDWPLDYAWIFSYTDQFGYDRNVEIICNQPPLP